MRLLVRSLESVCQRSPLCSPPETSVEAFFTAINQWKLWNRVKSWLLICPLMIRDWLLFQHVQYSRAEWSPEGSACRTVSTGLFFLNVYKINKKSHESKWGFRWGFLYWYDDIIIYNNNRVNNRVLLWYFRLGFHNNWSSVSYINCCIKHTVDPWFLTLLEVLNPFHMRIHWTLLYLFYFILQLIV